MMNILCIRSRSFRISYESRGAQEHFGSIEEEKKEVLLHAFFFKKPVVPLKVFICQYCVLFQDPELIA